MMQPGMKDRSEDPGVPEALTRSLIRLRDRLGWRGSYEPISALDAPEPLGPSVDDGRGEVL